MLDAVGRPVMHLGIEDLKLSAIARKLNVPRPTLHSYVERQGLVEAIRHFSEKNKAN
ncbi:hypothetical protein QO199_14895 [Serratia bockelmannii]|uniref:Uncharacterized protein n=1 Tax=Serratia bockelmannii TaxID=2703793 RepID=A0ABT8LRN1_9GAMM|nr:hypothetical protein [Serratia bockelmannii]MDN6879942.1 hypothetical protein [Serratia bockelmannii]HBH6889300.1 hypothetical protein [Serratia marcescens]